MLPLSTLMPAPLILLFALKAFLSSRPIFLLCDTVCTSLTALSLLLVPSHLLAYQTDVRLDPLSPYLARIAGTLLLASSLHAGRALTTPAALYEHAALSTSRAITAAMLFCCATYARLHYTIWNFRFTQLTITGAVAWFIPHFYYALFAVSTPAPEPRAVAPFLFLDYFATLAFGLLAFAFPQWLLRTLSAVPLNAVSVTLARVIGALLVGLASMSQAAVIHATLAAKKHVHVVRLLACGPVLVVVCAGWLRRCFNDVALAFGIIATVLCATNSALGCAMIVFLQGAKDAKRKLEEKPTLSPF